MDGTVRGGAGGGPGGGRSTASGGGRGRPPGGGRGSAPGGAGDGQAGPPAGELLARAASAGAAGDAKAARAGYLRAYRAARAAGDTALMADAALGLLPSHHFGTGAGQVPALLHEAYQAVSAGPTRARLAAALARAWAYSGEPRRGLPFAREALDLATGAGDPGVLAAALDAALLTRWDPGSFRERVTLAARLADTAAHLTDPQARLTAHLWRLTTAWECLDVVAVHRQLRALDLLAQESGSARIAFFAASRRAMHALATSDLPAAGRLLAQVRRLGGEAAEADTEAVLHSLAADRALQTGDRRALAEEAAAFGEYGAAEGIASVSAEAAALWLAAGEPRRALDLVHQLAGPGLDTVAHDVDFLLTVTKVVQVASALGVDHLTAGGARLLEPYAGRAVLNAGAVAFHGVVDDYLYQAHLSLGDGGAARWRQAALSSYQRIGATWWAGRLGRPTAPRQPGRPTPVHLYPQASGMWTVGHAGETTALPNLKGLHYLRHLLARPGAEIGALELSDAVAGHPGTGLAQPDLGEILDAQALAAYQRRLREIDAELAAAPAGPGEPWHERLRWERDELLGQVAAASGLAGRRRRAGSTRERARIAVRKAITSALHRIEHDDPGLARLLRDTVRTGASCRYDPDPARPVTWVLDRP